MFMEQSWREMVEKTWCSDFALCPVNLAWGAWQAKRLTVGNPVGLFFLDSFFQINPIFFNEISNSQICSREMQRQKESYSNNACAY